MLELALAFIVAPIVGAAAGFVLVGLVDALDLAIGKAHAEALFERQKRRLYRLAYAAEDLTAGDRVCVSTLQPEAYAVPRSMIEGPTGHRIHTVTADARKGQVVRLSHPELSELECGGFGCDARPQEWWF